MQHLYIFAKSFLGIACLVLFLSTGAAFAQTTTFTYKGQLTDAGGMPASGSYEMQFKLFDDAAAGNQVGGTLTLDGFGSNPPAVTVTSGVFTVQLDFGADAFPGADRYIEVAVKYPGETAFKPLRPRQQITSRPYAIRALAAAVADTAINSKQLGGREADQYVRTDDPRLSAAVPPTSGNSSYVQNTITQQVNSNFNISGDGTAGGTLSGNAVNTTTQYNLGGQRLLSALGTSSLFAGFGAGNDTMTGASNSFFGVDAGRGNTTGTGNSFFGHIAGQSNTTGEANSFVGMSAGFNNTTGGRNSFIGASAGLSNSTGSNNSFFGGSAGTFNLTGSNNSFFGSGAGINNLTGSNNTLIGSDANILSSADVGNGGLDHATAIGAGSVVSSSNTVVLGRPSDTVRVPGNLIVSGTLTSNGGDDYIQNTTNRQSSSNFNISGDGTAGGTLSGDTVNAATRYTLSGRSVLSTAGASNTVVLGVAADTVQIPGSLVLSGTLKGNLPSDSTNYVQNTTTPQTDTNFNISGNGTAGGALSGNTVNAVTQYNLGGERVLSAVAPSSNLFAGIHAGNSNTAGAGNSFVGAGAGQSNTTGSANSFVGASAGANNATGGGNSFVGTSAGQNNTSGSLNSFFGTGAGSSNTEGSSITLIGSNANVGSNTLNHATAIGAGSVVSLSNRVVLGRSDDTVEVPGNLVVSGSFSGGANYVLNTTTPQVSSNFNISGDGQAGGTLSGNTVRAETQYKLGADRVLTATGTGNLLVGIGAGQDNTTGFQNSFFGASAGQSNTTGDGNSFVGASAGFRNTIGIGNSFFGTQAGAGNTEGGANSFIGRSAGASNVTGSNNSFVGFGAGVRNTTGSSNSFVGTNAGANNTTGTNNTIIGYSANVAGTDLQYATAIGAGSLVSSSNRVVLGRSDDTVEVPGTLVVSGSFNLPADSASYVQNTTRPQASSNFNISGDGTAGGTLSANTVNAATQYNLGGDRVLSAAGATANLFAGTRAGDSNTGSANSFVGASAGQRNTTGSANSFVGAGAGQNTTTGVSNSFFGTGAGSINTEGSSITLVGSNANVGSPNLNYATAIGANSLVSSSNTVVLGRSDDTVQVPGDLNVSGTYNISGERVLSAAAAASNLFAGIGAGNGNTGSANSFVGARAGNLNTSGGGNSFVGAGAGAKNATGDANSFVGAGAGQNNTSGIGNSFFGNGTGGGNTEGTFNTLVGTLANVSNTTLTHATAIGAESTVENSNTIVLGRNTGADTVRVPGNLVVSGGNGIAGGTLSSNTVNAATQYNLGGNQVLSTAASNTVVLGRSSDTVQVPGTLLVSGSFNLPPDSAHYVQNTTREQASTNFNISGDGTAGGGLSGNTVNAKTQYNLDRKRVLSASATTKNVFAGIDTGNTGVSNSFVGSEAGLSNVSGTANSLFGAAAGRGIQTGHMNSFFGVTSGSTNIGGSSNSFFGWGTGQANTGGSFNTLIGWQANVGANNLQYATAIGAGSLVSSDNTVVLGRKDDIVQVPGNLLVATLGTAGKTKLCLNASNQVADCSSSLRYKTNIAPFSSGLSLVSRLRPISFDWKSGGARDVGFGAEEVAAINPLFVTYNSKGQVEGVQYDRLSAVFVNAFKEQQAQIEQQRDQIRKQQNQIDALRKIVCLDHPDAGVCR